MATLLNPFLRGLDANGDAASGALLYVFEAGTTTPVTTYSDSSLTTPQAHPLVANAAGEFEGVFLASGTYKFRVADADAVVLYERDNVRMADRPDDPIFLDDRDAIFADTTSYATGTVINGVEDDVKYMIAASGATDNSDVRTDGQKMYNLRGQNAKSFELLAAMPDGTVRELAGCLYKSESGLTGTQSAANDWGVDGVSISGPVKPQHFACPETGDQTAYIQKAVNYAAAREDFAGGSVLFPFRGLTKPYIVTDTIDLTNLRNLDIVAEGGGWGQDPAGGAVDYDWCNIHWHGASGKSVFQTNTSVFGIVFSRVSVWSDAGLQQSVSGAGRATAAFAFGDVEGTGTDSVKRCSLNDCAAYGGRYGVHFGHASASSQPDVAGLTIRGGYYYLNRDAGIATASGNAANVLIEGAGIAHNGFSPTTDTINVAGSGANIYNVSGEITVISATTAGRGVAEGSPFGYDTTPATGDIVQYGHGLVCINVWSETLGPFLYQRGGIQNLSLNGVRHFNGSMTDSNTPTSIDANATIVDTGSEYFGDISIATGNGGKFVGSGTQFYDGSTLGTVRPTMGVGKFTGTAFTSQRGLNTTGTGSNVGQQVFGGSDRDDMMENPSTSLPPNILAHLRDNPFLTMLDHASGGTGAGVGIDGTGAIKLMTGCYESTTGNFKAHKIGHCYVAYFGLGTNGAIDIFHYNFSDTTTAVSLGSFSRCVRIKSDGQTWNQAPEYTAATGSGTATALPAQPIKYIGVTLNDGTAGRIPVFAG